MSTSEIESGKAGLQSGKRINGWWRLWIVVSLIWLIFAISYAIAGWFDEGLNKEFANHNKILNQINPDKKKIIVENYKPNSGINVKRVEMVDSDRIINFKSDAEENEMVEFGGFYFETGKSIQFKKRTDYILIVLAIFTLPPIIIAVLGKSIAWIIKGFQ